MTIRTDPTLTSLSLAGAIGASGSGDSAFQLVYASTVQKTIEIDSIGGGMLGSTDDLTRTADIASNNLRRALRAYGIDMPPPMRIDTDPDTGQLGLENDPRNARFQGMLHDLPQLADQLNQVLGDAGIKRDADFSSACQLFSQGRDPKLAQAVIDHYIEIHDNPQLSLTYDGQSLSPQEKDGNGWRPMKTEKEFCWDLVKEAQNYVTVEDDRFDSLMKAVSGKPASEADGKQNSGQHQKKDDKQGKAAAPNATDGLGRL